MYGFTPKLPGDVTPPGLYDLQQASDQSSYQARELELLGQSRAAAFHRSQQQAIQMSERHDGSHVTKPNVFKVGDLVRRKVQRMPGMMIPKLSAKWDGPFEIGALGLHDSYYIKKDGIFEQHPVNANHLDYWIIPEEEGTVVDENRSA